MTAFPASPHSNVRAAATALLALLYVLNGDAGAARSAEKPAKASSQALQQVVVSARKYDRRTLEHVIVPRFVASHGAPSPTIEQVARWRAAVCPQATGLQSPYDEFVAKRVVAVAKSVGAPVGGAGRKCAIDVEIVFSAEPQKLLDHIAKAYPALLGSAPLARDTKFSRAIQSWYLTGTRAMNGYTPPVQGLDAPPPSDLPIFPNEAAPFAQGVAVDRPDGEGFVPGGLAGSHLSVGLTSEFLHVLVIVDSRKVAALSLRAISDYIAMIALTRMSSLDACSELPSIIDLLSSGCSGRAKPDSITLADTAFLKALYGSDLEPRLNIEQGDMHDRMLAVLETH